MTTAESTATARSSFSPSPSAAAFHRSPWHSPVPYLFGGLAAILVLITVALLMLACSYLHPPADGTERDVESGAAEKGDAGSGAEASPIFEEKFLVIMAGELKPTFLATPASGKGSAVEGGRDNDARREKEENTKRKDESEAATEEFRDS